jgi:hypothetical protein
MASYLVESFPKRFLKVIIIKVKVLISSGLNTKDNLYTRKGHVEQGNLSVGPIDDIYNKTISLYLLKHYFKEH